MTEAKDPIGTEPTAVVDAADLLAHYSFDLGGAGLAQLLAQWFQQYQPSWVRLAVIEALYQGRYKAVSVEQILALWQRRQRPLYHFNHEFERLVCHGFPRNLTISEPPRPDPSPTRSPLPSEATDPGLPPTSLPDSEPLSSNEAGPDGMTPASRELGQRLVEDDWTTGPLLPEVGVSSGVDSKLGLRTTSPLPPWSPKAPTKPALPPSRQATPRPTKPQDSIAGAGKQENLAVPSEPMPAAEFVESHPTLQPVVAPAGADPPPMPAAEPVEAQTTLQPVAAPTGGDLPDKPADQRDDNPIAQ